VPVEEFILPRITSTPTGFLFPCPSYPHRREMMAKVVTVLRSATNIPGVMNYSLRRGALQCLAASGASTKTLLNFSGHASETTLRTYLQFGQLIRSEQTVNKPFLSSLVSPSDKKRC
jgi:integrase